MKNQKEKIPVFEPDDLIPLKEVKERLALKDYRSAKIFLIQNHATEFPLTKSTKRYSWKQISTIVNNLGNSMGERF